MINTLFRLAFILIIMSLVCNLLFVIPVVFQADYNFTVLKKHVTATNIILKTLFLIGVSSIIFSVLLFATDVAFALTEMWMHATFF